MRMNKLTKQRRTVNDKSKGYLPMNEQEFKEDLKYRMEQDILHPHCDCPTCQEAHKKFKEEPESFLENVGKIILSKLTESLAQMKNSMRSLKNMD